MTTRESRGYRRAECQLFAVDADSLRGDPWTDGVVYILPRASFEMLQEGEWICRAAARPLASLPVTPADFPFLKETCGVDMRIGMPDLQSARLSPLGEVQLYAIRGHRH